MIKMKTLTIGDVTYEIVDARAREQLAALENGNAGSYIITGTWRDEDIDGLINYYAVFDDNYSWTDLLSAINNNYYINCVLRHHLEDSLDLRLALTNSDSNGYCYFTGMIGNQYAVELQVTEANGPESMLVFDIPEGEAVYNEIASLAEYVDEVTSNTISYNSQTLTEEQKAQARANIGAGTSNAESWNDIKDKPFGEDKAFEPITWDGNIDGYETVEWNGQYLVKVYDEPICMDANLVHGVKAYSFEDGGIEGLFLTSEMVAGGMVFADEHGFTIAGMAICSDGQFAGIGFPVAKGTWVTYAPNYAYTTEIIPVTTLKPIEEKFIPDTIARTADLDTKIEEAISVKADKSEIITSWNNLEDRPIVTEYNVTSGDVVVAASDAITTVTSPFEFGYLIDKRWYVHDGATVDVFFDGVLYESFGIDKDKVLLGSKYIYKTDDIHGDLCYMLKKNRVTMLCVICIDVPPFAVDTTVTIAYRYPEAIKFDESYIPDTIARTSDVDTKIKEAIAVIPTPDVTHNWNDITDKPRYLPVVEASTIEILPETQLMDAGGGSFIHAGVVEGIEAGNRYIVTYNGVEYSCVAMEVNFSGVDVVMLGNTAALGVAPSENFEPFVAMVAPPELAAEDGIGLVVWVIDGVTEVTLAIRPPVTYTKKLDNECLDLDWLPVHRTTPVLEEMTVAHEAVIGDNNMINEMVSYEVSFDGVTYHLQGIYRDLGAVRTERYIGNRKLYERYDDDVEDTGEPFLIRSYLGPDAATTTVYAADEGEHTISISIVLRLNKMPEYYLPNSVATKSYVDSAIAAIPTPDVTVSWNDLTDKPFGEMPTGGDTLTWDGNTEGLLEVTAADRNGTTRTYYKVSDAVPTWNDLLQGNDSEEVCLIKNGSSTLYGGAQKEEMMAMIDDCLRVLGVAELYLVGEGGKIASLIEEIVCVMEDNYTHGNFNFPEKGTYFSPNVDTLWLRGCTSFPITKQIDEKYLPMDDIIAKVLAALPTWEGGSY